MCKLLIFPLYFFIYSCKSYNSYTSKEFKIKYDNTDDDYLYYKIDFPYKGSQVVIVKYFNNSLDQNNYLDYINKSIPSLQKIFREYAIALINFIVYPEDAPKLMNLFGYDVSVWLSFDWKNYSSYSNKCQWLYKANFSNDLNDYFELIDRENSLLRKICFINTAYINIQEPYNEDVIIISKKTTFTLILALVGIVLFMILSFLCIAYCKYRRFINNSENEFEDFKSE